MQERAPGRAGKGPPDVLVELAEERTTVGELIGRTVQEQVRMLTLDAAGNHDTPARRYLLDEEIQAQGFAGVVRLPTRISASPDVVGAVTRAHRAFERHAYVVLVGGHQVERLDEEVVLRPGEPVVFLRLSALAGG